MNLSPNVIAHFPYLAAVARHNSFTRAAESLHISQAAVSYQIRQLEDKVGAKLILRQSGSHLSLTKAGSALVNEYMACEKRLRLTLESIKPKSLSGVLRLTAPVDFSSIVLPQMLAELREQAPNLEIEIDISDNMVDLQRSKFDFSIRANAVKGNILDPSLMSELIVISQKSLVASQDYLKAFGAIHSLEDLASHTLLVRDRNTHSSWQLLLKAANLSLADIPNRVRLNSTFALFEGVKAGLGIAILPKFTIMDALQSGEVIPLLEPHIQPFSTKFYLSYDEAIADSPLKHLLVQCLQKACAKPKFKDVWSEIPV